jgi:hypothetical protein
VIISRNSREINNCLPRLEASDLVTVTVDIASNGVLIDGVCLRNGRLGIVRLSVASTLLSCQEVEGEGERETHQNK